VPVCSICTYRAERFATIGLDFPVNRELDVVGAGPRAVSCPRCGATDRDRLIHLMFTRSPWFPLSPATEVLHLAPERVLYLHLVEQKLGRYVTGDLDPSRYPWAAGIQAIDLLALPFADRSFDYILANHVLEHIPDDHRAMTELLRVLKPGGRAVLQVPYSLKIPTTLEDPAVTTPEERALRFGQDDHVRIYGPDYPARLEKAGFKVQLAQPELWSSEARLYAVNPVEQVFIAIRPPLAP
jgi:SAM-dependent methyltransferase